VATTFPVPETVSVEPLPSVAEPYRQKPTHRFSTEKQTAASKNGAIQDSREALAKRSRQPTDSRRAAAARKSEVKETLLNISKGLPPRPGGAGTEARPDGPA